MKPLYRLRQLIYNKYGEKNFALGCEIVARWVEFDTQQNCSMEEVVNWCNISKQVPVSETFLHGHISIKQFAALSQLFNLHNNTLNFYSNE